MRVEQISHEKEWPTLAGNAMFPRLNGHGQAWFQAVAAGLGHTGHVLVIRKDPNSLRGMLPLMLVRSAIFGRFLVSLPYLNTGGVWAEDEEAALELISSACELADRLDVRYLELRHEVPVPHPKLGAQRRDKVHMRLELPPTDSGLDRTFPSKLRSQIKKATQHELRIEWGQQELLPDFYDVFARNMRDLGTPVYSRNLFDRILEHFSGDAELCVVKRGQSTLAAAMLVHHAERTEVPSASSLRQYNQTNANMWMYRQLLRRAIERGSRSFDFGRSSQGSGTYRFKAQWGAQPHPTVWQYYVRKGSIDELRPDADGKKGLVEIWKKLPVPLTRLIGPSIVRGIP